MCKQTGAGLKLADFGTAIEVQGTEFGWHGFCGTPSYISPEMLNRQAYGKAVDMWACGIIVYVLLSGSLPFYSENQKELFEWIKKGKYDCSTPPWDTVSSAGKNLLGTIIILRHHFL